MLAEKHAINLPDLDEHGLLIDPQQWNEAVAQLLAAEKGISVLTDAHWAIIHALREHYAKFEFPPAMSHLCRKQGMSINCAHELFYTCLTAWQVSGLPNPGEEAKSYLSAM